MTFSLRWRIWLTLAPLLLLLALLGAAGLVLLQRLGSASEAILRENYDSVVAMVGLNEALERIDSSFQFAISGQPDAREAYDANWPAFNHNLDIERNNITLPGEQELADRLAALRDRYRAEGDAFYADPEGLVGGAALADSAARPRRRLAYFGTPWQSGLLARFKQIKEVSGEVRLLNQRNMEEASRDARALADASRLWLGGALVAAALLAGGLAGWTARAILRPVRAVTEAALAVGAGDLDRHVPVVAHDELGQLAEAFNRMAARLKDYRASNAARLVRAQQASQATIDSFPDPVLLVDTEGRVEMANPAARRLLGVAPAEDGRPAPAWQPPEALRQPLAEALQKQEPFRAESLDQAVGFRLDGEERVYLPRLLPVRDPHGGTLGAAVVLNDVTRFRVLDQLKGDLVATVSHELKTPLTGIRLAVHLLLEEAVGPLTPKQTELLLDARENAERLLNMIEHLLALARLQRAERAVELRPEDPAELLQRAAEAARPRAEDRHLELAVDAGEGLPPVAADAGRLGQALNNLLDNALAHTPPGGKVTLSASDLGDGRVQLTVADTGEGIPAEYLPHVFERFFRVPGRDGRPGTGLGLAIVKEVVAAHGGAIEVESRPGEGTAFRLTLPAWRGEGEGRQADKETRRQGDENGPGAGG